MLPSRAQNRIAFDFSAAKTKEITFQPDEETPTLFDPLLTRGLSAGRGWLCAWLLTNGRLSMSLVHPFDAKHVKKSGFTF